MLERHACAWQRAFFVFGARYLFDGQYSQCNQLLVCLLASRPKSAEYTLRLRGQHSRAQHTMGYRVKDRTLFSTHTARSRARSDARP